MKKSLNSQLSYLYIYRKEQIADAERPDKANGIKKLSRTLL
jgi:hypothetical protein